MSGTQWLVGGTMLAGGVAMLACGVATLYAPRHRTSGWRSQCAKDAYHCRWYDPASDRTFCTRCSMLWEDADLSGRPSSTYTVERGWTIDEPLVPKGPIYSGD